MRLCAPLFGDTSTPSAWIEELKRLGYRAAMCPVTPATSDDLVQAYVRAARENDIVIAEVGAWSNPLDPDENARRAALQKCKECLDLADRVGARCCVNLSGWRSEHWGPHPLNFTPETFEMIVECVREIIDEVQPRRTFYALEAMPWLYPDSPDTYLRLLEAIDRPQCAVHLDPVNMISSPQLYFANAHFLRECFRKLGSRIQSCHAKDVAIQTNLTAHFEEVRPGLGGLDYGVFLAELHQLDANIPLLLEHLPDEAEYVLAATHIRSVAAKMQIPV